MAEIKLPSEPTGRQITALFARVQKGENSLTDLTVDCSEILDLSAEAMATLVRSLSDLQKEGMRVRLVNPPQLLGHNCYRQNGEDCQYRHKTAPRFSPSNPVAGGLQMVPRFATICKGSLSKYSIFRIAFVYFWKFRPA